MFTRSYLSYRDNINLNHLVQQNVNNQFRETYTISCNTSKGTWDATGKTNLIIINWPNSSPDTITNGSKSNTRLLLSQKHWRDVIGGGGSQAGGGGDGNALLLAVILSADLFSCTASLVSLNLQGERLTCLFTRQRNAQTWRHLRGIFIL